MSTSPIKPGATWQCLAVVGLLTAAASTLFALVVRWAFIEFLVGQGPLLRALWFAPVLVLTFVVVLAARPRLTRVSRSLHAVVGLSATLGVLAVWIVTTPQISQAFLGNPGALAMPIGITLVSIGSPMFYQGMKGKRVGESFHCPKCDYERGDREEDAPIRCPECAHPWLGGWVKGRLVRSPRRAWTGAAMVLVPALLFASSMTSIGASIVRTLPNGVVIVIASLDAWGKNTAAWTEIGKRSLTSEEEATLARRLLDVRLSNGYLYGAPGLWLEPTVLNGGKSGPLPQSLRDRYFAELFDARIRVPDRVQRDATVPIEIVGSNRSGGAPNWLYIWIDEVRVDGQVLDPAPWRPKNSSGWFFSLDLADDRGALIRQFMPEGLPDPPLLNTAAAGTRHITVRLKKQLLPKNTGPGSGAPPLFTATETIEKTVIVEGP